MQVIVLYNLLYASLGFQLSSSLKWGWKTEPTSGFFRKKNSRFVSHQQSLLRKGSINESTDILKQQSQILNVIAKAKVLKKTEYIPSDYFQKRKYFKCLSLGTSSGEKQVCPYTNVLRLRAGL